jgi:hypothetical protein
MPHIGCHTCISTPACHYVFVAHSGLPVPAGLPAVYGGLVPGPALGGTALPICTGGAHPV